MIELIYQIKHKVVINLSISKVIFDTFKLDVFSVKDAYELFPETAKETVRARIYDNLNNLFNRVSRGKYECLINESDSILINDSGREMTSISNESIDCIITDHPWLDKKSNRGGNRSFANYDAFSYTQEDFDEKFRVLKKGHFLVEFLPSENANNYEYLYEIKQMAKKAGFEYYSKIPWVKGTFVSNTGRNSKNSEDVMFFTKGKAMCLRPDAKKNKQDGTLNNFMSGAKKMLPTCFNFQPPTKANKIHQSEKPIDLIREILTYISNINDIILDQFAGSGNSLIASVKNGCKAIGFELNKEIFLKAKDNISNNDVNCLSIN